MTQSKESLATCPSYVKEPDGPLLARLSIVESSLVSPILAGTTCLMVEFNPVPGWIVDLTPYIE